MSPPCLAIALNQNEGNYGSIPYIIKPVKTIPLRLITFLSLVALLLAACGNRQPAPIEDIPPVVENRSGIAEPVAPGGEIARLNCPDYYTEKFNGSETEGCWTSTPPLIVTTTKPDQVTMSAGEAGLNLVIDDDQTDAYIFYGGGIYPDVNLQSSITSSGVNNHMAALVCRANDKGWYEARVSTSGFFSIYRYDTEKRTAKKNPYTNYIVDTPSSAINTGNDKTNVIQFVCIGNTLILNINGTEVYNRAIAEQTEPGLVGVGGLSLENFPVNLTFTNILIGQP